MENKRENKKFYKKIIIVLLSAWLFMLIIPLNTVVYNKDGYNYEPQNYGFKNLAMPDLENKEYLGDGIYRVYSNNGITIDYNTFNGQYKINGTWNGETGGIVFMDYSTELIGYTNSISVNIISGLVPNNVYYRPSGLIEYSLDLFEGQKLSIVYTRNRDYLRMVNGATFNDFIYTVQIEKGDTATDYEVPIEPLIYHYRGGIKNA